MKPVYWFLLSFLVNVSAWGSEPSETPFPLNIREMDTFGRSTQLVGAVQSDDGTLWFAETGHGLFAFDGFRFTHYEGHAGGRLLSRTINRMAAWPNDGLWVGYSYGEVAHLKDGRWTTYGSDDGLPEGSMISIFRDPSNTVWITARNGMARFNGQRWEKIPLMSDSHVSFLPYEALFDQQGVLWVTSADRMYIRFPGEEQFHDIAPLSFAANSNARMIALAPDGAVWVSEPDGLTRIRLKPTLSVRKYPASRFSNIRFDREGNLWLGSYAPAAQMRWLSANAVKADLSEEDLQRRLVTVPVPGSSAQFFYPLVEDREGNMWVMGGGKLYRFSRSPIATFYRSTDVSLSPLITVDGDNTLWIAVPHSADGELLEVRDGQIRSSQATSKYTSSYRDPDGTLWFGGPNTLAHLVQGKLVSTALPDSMKDYDVQSMVRDAEGAWWVGVVRRGFFRYTNGNWVPNGGYAALPANLVPVATTLDAEGALWLGYPKDRLARVKDGSAEFFSPTDGLDVGNIQVIHTGPHMWIGGDAGIVRFDGKRFHALFGAGERRFVGVSGIIETGSGDLWLNGSDGISHISAAEVAHTLADPSYEPQYDMLDYLDGLPGAAVTVRPLPSATSTGDRMWFSLSGGYVVSIDPKNTIRNPLAPPVKIWSITAQDRKYEPDMGPIDLPEHTTSLKISYTAGSLTVPERVRFRYRLDGLDKDWQNGGGQRDAYYTNLSPGSYTFDVIAANNDGVWNNIGASLHFTIKPAWYQTRAFIAAVSLLIAGLLWWAFRWRLRTVHERMRTRLEERMGERERIARELHDTFLQSVQGLMLKFQSAAQKLPDSEPARQSIEQSLDHADQVIIEGRDRVSALRRINASRDLPRAVRAIGEELRRGGATAFEMTIEGKERPFHPFVGDELYRIAAEALANAFRHARAQTVEVVISYGRREVCLRIADDGEGFEPKNISSRGAADHWGLQGMHERATKIHARLTVESKRGHGAAVEVTLANSVAFRRADEAKSAAAMI